MTSEGHCCHRDNEGFPQKCKTVSPLYLSLECKRRENLTQTGKDLLQSSINIQSYTKNPVKRFIACIPGAWWNGCCILLTRENSQPEENFIHGLTTQRLLFHKHFGPTLRPKEAIPFLFLIQHCPLPFSGIQKVHLAAVDQSGDQTHIWAIQAPLPDTAFSWVGFPAQHAVQLHETSGGTRNCISPRGKLMAGCWNKMIFNVPFNPDHSMGKENAGLPTPWQCCLLV